MGCSVCVGESQTKNIKDHQWSLYSRLSIPLESGCNYEGDWERGRPHGAGKAKWPDGWTFEGEFVDGVPHGGNLQSPGVLHDRSGSGGSNMMRKSTSKLSGGNNMPGSASTSQIFKA